MSTRFRHLACSLTVIAGVAGLGISAHAADKKTVALVFAQKGNPFYASMEAGARKKAEELGVNFIADGPPEVSAALETPIIDAMIAKHVDAMLVVPPDPQALIPVLQRANDAGIPVITVDQYIGPDGDYENGPVKFPVSYVGTDNFGAGKASCEALIKSMGGKGELYILTSTPFVPADINRSGGCAEAAKEAGDSVTLLGVGYTQNSATNATSLTQAMLQRSPNLAGIFGTNLYSAQGAAAAVKSANLTGTVKVANFDADEQAMDNLRNNAVDLVTAQQPGEMGSTGVQLAVDALNGKTDIKKKVILPAFIITRDNIDSAEAKEALSKAYIISK